MAEASSQLLAGLRALLYETRQMSGRAFLERITIGLSQLLGGVYAQIGHLSSDARSIRADPCAQSGRSLDPLQYELVDTPCEHVVGATTRHFIDDVIEEYPRDHFLVEYGFIGYLGCPMFFSDGRPSGLLSILSTTPLSLSTAEVTVLEALAMRAGADLERLEAVEARAASEALVREIVDQQTEMVCRFTHDGRVTFANHAYRATFGLSPEDLGDFRYQSRLHPDDAEHVRRELSKITADNPRSVIENRILDPNDEILWTQWTNLGLYDDDGNLVGYQAAGRNITDAKRAEEQLQQLYDELRQEHEHKDQFLAMLAHELRNPLGAILNAVSVLELSPSGSASSSAVAIAKRQALQQSRLLDDLLDVSRITRGKIELKHRFVSPFEIAASVAEARRGAFEERSQSLEIDLPEQAAVVHADPVRLEQVFANLLDNASKYTPTGGRIRLEGATADGFATLRVVDTGKGISTDMLERVFDMFQQGTQRGSVTSGLGVGLTIVRELVKRHGGTVTASSDGVGAGSTFTLRLPTVASPKMQSTESAGEGPCATSRRVLVVDDNVDAADMLAQLLRGWGHEVTTVYDGKSAIQRARERSFDVALIDIAMPEMDGHETARQLRAEHPNDETRLVAVTGFGQPSDVKRAYEACFDEHLTKPADHRRLREILDTR